MKALIDGDVIVYWAANAMQTNEYDILNKKGEVLNTQDSKRPANSSLASLQEFSDEPMEISPGRVVLEPWRKCEEYVDNFITKIVKDAKWDDFEVHLSGKTNFRKKVAVTKPYKGNRSGERPYYYLKVRDYLEEKYKASISDNEEADDTLAIAQTEDLDNTVLCTIDKDLWMVEGAKYDFKREESSYVTAYDGIRNFQYQMMTGDRVDNIQGVPKVGEVKAHRLLDANEDVDGAWQSIAEMYKTAYGSNYKTVMLEMGRLLWMRLEVGQMWELPNVLNNVNIKEKANG